jgi:S1-C subfamily serine protease
MKSYKLIVVFLLGLFVGLYIQRVVYLNKIHAQDINKLRNELRSLDDPTRIYSIVTRIVSPSIVGITGELEVRRNVFDFDLFEELFFNTRRRKETFQVKGSGIVYDDKHIVTNYHVIRPVLASDGFGTAKCDLKGANQVGTVMVHLYNEKSVKAQVIGCDPTNDVAVLSVSSGGLVVPEFGDSEKIEVAQGVLVLGNPFGLGISVSSGIIGAKERRLVFRENEEFRAPLIQVNASINKGNSGGALVNLKGEVIGLVTAAVLSADASATSGIGFAVPINVVKKVVKKILSKSSKPFIGIGYIDITEANLPWYVERYKENYTSIEQLLNDLGLEKEGGIFITGVVKNSPADKAGLREGDVILKINDDEVNDAAKLQEILLNYSPGDRITLEIVRSKKKKKIELVLGSR